MKDATGPAFVYQSIAAMLTMLDGEHVEQCLRCSMTSMLSSAHDTRWQTY